MLAIQSYIQTHGLENAISKFKLKCTDYGHKVCLKYNQIESDLSLEEVRDCRGLVLEKDTWRVMSLGFRKFFNLREPNADKIDWDSALVLEKLDGTFVHLYWDWHEENWCVGTTGTDFRS